MNRWRNAIDAQKLPEMEADEGDSDGAAELHCDSDSVQTQRDLHVFEQGGSS